MGIWHAKCGFVLLFIVFQSEFELTLKTFIKKSGYFCNELRLFSEFLFEKKNFSIFASMTVFQCIKQ